MQALDRKFTKTYNLPEAQASFKYTTMVRHKGTVIAFSMDDQRHIYYSVLDFERQDIKSTLDSQYWNDKPQELRFPTELAQVGFSAAGVYKLPTFRKNGQDAPETLNDKEKDLFLSTTARFTADAPFQVLSDDQHIYVFRQAISQGHPNNIQLTDTTALVDSTLLCDRFVLVNGQLNLKLETRYQRSRNKDLAADRKDSLGYEDLEKKPFYEPTQEIAFVRNLVGGRFSAVLLPTSLPDVQRWQIFAYNNATQRMDAFNIARSPDGLFNTRGTRYYTSSDPKRQKDVFERSPIDPATKEELIPIISQAGYAESALAFDGVGSFVTIPPLKGSQPALQDFTIELWLQAASSAKSSPECTLLERNPYSIRYFQSGEKAGTISVSRTDGNSQVTITSTQKINDGEFHHIALVRTTIAEGNSKQAQLLLLIDGQDNGSTMIDVIETTTRDSRILLGSRDGTTDFFSGTIDELRLWQRGRSTSELKSDMHYRLIGNEPELVGYWRFDEGAGNTIYDQSDFANHGKLSHTTLNNQVNTQIPKLDSQIRELDAQILEIDAEIPSVNSQIQRLNAQSQQTDVQIQQTDVQIQQTDIQIQQIDVQIKQIDVQIKQTPIKNLSRQLERERERLVSKQAALKQAKDELRSRNSSLVQQKNVLSQQKNNFVQQERSYSQQKNDLSQQKNSLLQTKQSLLNQSQLSLQQMWIASNAPVGEHPGVRRSSFAIDGRQIASGCTALLYYQQEQAETGYNPLEKKPIKRNARVMLAVPTAPTGQTENAKNTIAVLDFAVSREGGLVQVPDQLPLTTLDQPSLNGGSINDISDKISQLEQAEQDLTSLIKEKNIQIQGLQERLDTSPICDVALMSNYTADGIYFFNGDKVAKSTAPSDIQSIAASAWRGLPADWTATGIDAIVPWGTEGLQCYIFKGDQCLYYDAVNYRPIPETAQPRPIKEVFTLPTGSSVDWSSGIDAGIRYDRFTAYLFKGNQCLIFNGLGGSSSDQKLTRTASRSASIKQEFPGVPTSLGDIDAAYVNGEIVLFLKGGKFARSKVGVSSDPSYKPYGSLEQEGLSSLVTFYEKMRSTTQTTVDQLKKDVSNSEKSLQQVQLMLAEQRKLVQNIRGDVRLEMPLLHIDPTGLTLSGALLGFAWSDRPPLLFESVNGRVSLYFRGQNEQFFVAYYDVVAQRSQYTLEARTESGSRSFVKLIARSTNQQKSAIEIYAEDNPDFCTVKITNTETGMIETWKSVPRQVQAFADVLNGVAGESGNSVPYNYSANAKTNKLTHTLTTGSLSFRVNSADAIGQIALIDGKQIATSDPSINPQANAWFSDSQGSALSLSERVPTLSASSTQIPRFAFDDDLTLEAWVNHGSFSVGTARILNYNSDDSTKSYALGLFRDATINLEEQYGVFVGVGDRWVRTTPVSSVQQWRHIAAVFQQSYALQFSNADDVVNCGNDLTLDLPEDLTIEAIVRLKEPLNAPQAILTKGKIDDGTNQDCAYSLYIDRTGQLVFAFEDKDHGNQFLTPAEHTTGSIRLEAGDTYRIAVTRKYNTEVKTTDDRTEVNSWFDISFYVSREGGALQKSLCKPYKGSIATNKQPLEIGQAMARIGNDSSKVEPCYLNGDLSEVRIWNRTLTEAEVCRTIHGDEKGLVSWWRFEENQGTRAYDSKGNNHGTIANATWTKSSDPELSRLTVYINGESVLTTPWTQGNPTYGQVKQFAIGEPSRFQGQLDDIRIWNIARTEEQIQDNLFRRVNGDFEHLLAYYNCNTGQEEVLPDRSGNSLDLTLPASMNYFVMSTAPISSETAQVRGALAQVKTPFHVAIDAAPAVQEYGDMQSDSSGMAIGVMKRCYAYIKEGKWYLITGYKVSDLELEWIGQAQYEPQLVGFIEGAPPVPSENLTARGSDRAYQDVSAIELSEADRVTYTYAASKENGLDTSLKFKAGVGVDSETLAGVGVASSIEDISVQVGVQGSIDISKGWLNEQRVGFAKGTNRLSRLATQGNWENPNDIQYEDLGKRFIPKNVGFALVKSKTADIFALRLKHPEPQKRVTIALSMRPNPDIPEDWNIITFPINPHYTKQGTLDGHIGIHSNEKDYPNLSDRSYFKPREAYALKQRIEREQQQLAADSLRYSTDAIKGMENQKEMSKRLPIATQMNLFNTYVWTADGGLFAETQNTMNFKQEVIGGSFSVAGMAGMFATADISIGKAAVSFELEALMGGHLNLTSQRSQDSETGFEVNVSLDVERNIMIEGRYENGEPVKCPGKVDGYRFMTFYLQPDIEHFKDFENKVVDRTWLESDEPSAKALKQAISNQSGTPWRVLHRVTYVSRVLPTIGQGMTQAEEALRAANIESNWELIKTLEPFVKGKFTNYPELKQAVEQAVDRYLPKLVPAKTKIVEYMSLYYQVFPTV